METAVTLGEGLVFAENADSGERTIFSSKFACPVSGFTIDEIEPRLFSFNNPFGACPACDGYGSADGQPCGTWARDFGSDDPGPCPVCKGTGDAPDGLTIPERDEKTAHTQENE